MERTWQSAIEQGKTVDVSISPQYRGDSKRPSSFDVSYSIDNENFDIRIGN